MTTPNPDPPLTTWVAGPMPRAKGETLYVLRHELKDVCAEVEGLKRTRISLPWYFVLASAGASITGAGILGLLTFYGVRKADRPEEWLLYAYGTMTLVGGTAAMILFIIGLITKGGYDEKVDIITKKLRDLEYESPEAK